MTQQITEEDVRNMLRQEIRKAGNAAAWGRENNVHHSRISEFLSGDKPPSPLILIALRVKPIKLYESY